MEFVSLAVDKILEYTLSPVARQVGYVIFYNKNIKELKDQAEQLLRKRENVEHRVEEAKRNVEEIEGEVLDWQHKVDEIACMAKKLLDEDNKCHRRNVEEIRNAVLSSPTEIAFQESEFLDDDNDKRRKTDGCSSRSFSSLCWRHQLSRKAKKLTQEIIDINTKEFSQVAYRGELNITKIGSSTTNEEAFESRVSALNQIMVALSDPNINMIGVYGLGGVGKTTLVLEVAKKAKEKSSDLTVVIVTVKQNPEIREIQQQIAEMLQFKLEEQTDIARGIWLCQRIEQEKNVLLILDDLWEGLDLNKIGISCGKDKNNYKLLMTSRNRAVLSDQMNTQKNFWLRELSYSEAWMLLKEKAALNESSESVQLLSIAKDITAQCGGLPIAIVIIGSSLKRKKISEWKAVLQQLKSHHYSNITPPIEVSYNNLESDILKSMFVLAGVITSPSTLDLFKYSCGLGLFHDLVKMEDMQNRFEMCIRTLKDSCLLQDDENSNSNFIMHDVVREAAISIASRNEFFLKRNERISEEKWLNDDKLKGCKAIFLDFCHFEKLSKGLDCPSLTFFHLYNNDTSLKLPDNFFVGTPTLKVLVLTKMNFEFLPSSINLLSNLHTLCLHQCVLGNIERIAELNGLKILSLQGSDIKYWPQKLGELSMLQLLDLRHCFPLILIPPGVLSKLKMLEVLLTDASTQWADDNQQSAASLAELNELSHLNCLEVHIRNENMLPREPIFEKLQRYNISIGSSHDVAEFDFSKALYLEHDDGINYPKHYFRGLLDHVETLQLGRFEDAKSVVPGINEEGLLELKHLEVGHNNKLQFIAESGGHRALFPNLESLSVQYSSNLINLWCGTLVERSFSKLTKIFVYGCHSLKSLGSFSLPTCLPQLNKIGVYQSNVLEGIISDDGKVVGLLQFPELRYLTVQNVAALTGFYSEGKKSSKAPQKRMQQADDDSLEPPVAFFSPKVIFPKLENLSIKNARKLKKIWDWQGQQIDWSSFQNLKAINVHGCHFISELIPFNVLEKLEELNVESCNSLEVIFDLEGTKKEGAHDVKKSSHLWKLTLNNLPKLKHIWNKDSQRILNFQHLSVFKVEKCKSLQYLFPFSVVKALKKLQDIRIINCSELETIVGRNEEGADDASISFVFSQVTKLELNNLPNLRRFFPGSYSAEWPQLEELHHVSVHSELNIFETRLLKTSNQLPLSIEKAIPNLKMLELDKEATMTWIRQFPADHFNKLEHLTLIFFKDANTIFPYSFLQRMSKLEALAITSSSFEKIFPFENQAVGEKQNGYGVQLKILHLVRLDKLRYICEEVQELDRSLKYLESFHVQYCSSLLNLGPSLMTFNFLKTLEVTGCDQLLYLMASSTAKSLSQLEELEIEYCEKLKEIIVDEVADAETKNKVIIFHKLKTLKFHYLDRLESFCSMNYIFDFPSLENVMLSYCYKMRMFSKSVKHSSELQTVKLSKYDQHGKWEGDLNSTVQQMYMDELYFSTRYLSLSENPELKAVWHSQLPDRAFGVLKRLIVSNCEWFLKLLPLSVLKCLVNLEELKVESCESLEVVFDLEGAKDLLRDNKLTMKLIKLTLVSLPSLKHVWNKDPQGILDFPKPTRLKLMDAPELEPLSVEKAFPNLMSLEIDKKAMMTLHGQCQAENFKEYRYRKLTLFNHASTRFAFEEIFPFEIKECSSVLNMGPSSITFSLFKSLKVEKCEHLLYLMASSTAKCLGQLEELVISECRKIKEIVVDEVADVETNDEITYSNLKILKLKNLTSLESFCSMNYVFNFPSLEELAICQCPNLKTFSKRDPNTPKLKSVTHSASISWYARRHWENDLNSTLQKLYRDQVASQSSDHASSHVDGNGEDKLLNKPEKKRLVEEEKYKESKIEDHKEHEEMKVGNKNMDVIMQNTASYPEGRDSDLQTPTAHDFNHSAPFKATSQEYQTSEEGANEKVEDRNIIDQSIANYSEIKEYHVKETQGLDTSMQNVDTQNKLQEQHKNFSEIMEETATISHQKGLPLEISPEATSSHDSVIEEQIGEVVMIEQNQVTIEFLDRNAIELIDSVSTVSTSEELMQFVNRSSPICQSFSSIADAAVSTGKIPSELDLSKATNTIADFPKMLEYSYQGQRNEGKNETHLDNLNYETGSLGEATLEMPSSIPVLQFEQTMVPVGDLPSDLNLGNKAKQWENFDSTVGPSCSFEVKPFNVVQSTKDCQESDSNGSKSNSFLQTQAMTRHGEELQAKEIHQELKKPHISPTNKGESVKERAEEVAQKDPTARKLELAVSSIAHEENKASRELQLLPTNSHLSPTSCSNPANSHQPLGSVTEASGFLTLPSVDTTATSSPPLASLLEDLLSQLHLLLSSEDMTYLRNGFSRYPWALNLLESWSDKCWNWSYFVIFARVLYILQTTTAANLSEALYAELNSSLSTLGNVGFDANWIASVHNRLSDCQASLTSFHEAKALRATKDAIASRLIEFESLVDAMRAELAGIDELLAKYAHREELAHNVIGLP